MARVDKVIVTNVSRLKQKYGAGYQAIQRAVKALIAADKRRRLTTRLVALDDAAAMKRVQGRRVTTFHDCKQNKTAIDTIYRALAPDYLVILGSVDVIPHQDVRNPAYTGPEGDPDRYAYSDLPYACEAPYSKRPEDFRGPTRVVGRVPDITGGRDPGYLVALLETAADYTTLAREDYLPYFGLSAAVWKRSTALSLENTFGSSQGLQLSPPKGYEWPGSLLARRMHFINCHGAEVDAFFYGQLRTNYPHAHSAAYLDKRIMEGTIVAAECCYGAELYNPAGAQGQMGIAQTYLANKAYAYFGSSTIAYGPSEGNGAADLLCQFFLQQVLNGASVGRAALEARQRFVQSANLLEPTDLKTLAQFTLLGDPAIHPVQPAYHALSKTRAFSQAFPGPKPLPLGRLLRRDRLMKTGLALGRTVSAVKRKAGLRPPRQVTEVLAQAVRESDISRPTLVSFAVHDPAPNPYRPKKTFGGREVYVAIGRRRHTSERVWEVVAVAATVQQGRIVRLRRLHSR
ncbi:hypothetical protein [Candidatus Nitrospira bockiana]